MTIHTADMSYDRRVRRARPSREHRHRRRNPFPLSLAIFLSVSILRGSLWCLIGHSVLNVEELRVKFNPELLPNYRV